jgi:catabolite regulation protein CreA
MDRESVGAKKQEGKNLFKKGEELGFEDKRVKKFSDMKMIEMVGSEHVQKGSKVLREKRQDWRVSNINFF